jgi:hypothetical protein
VQDELHHENVRHAVRLLFDEYVPKCAAFLDSRSAREYRHHMVYLSLSLSLSDQYRQLGEHLHAFGINLRLMGKVRQAIKSDHMRTRMLLEASARLLKARDPLARCVSDRGV